MAAVIIPRHQLRIPDHLRGRLERPALRVVAPPGTRPATVPLGDPLRRVPTTGRAARPVGAVRRGAAVRTAPVVRPTLQPLAIERRRGSSARLVVVACMAIVALTGLTALAVGGPASTSAPAPAPVAAPTLDATSPTMAAVSGGTWVVQPGDSLWSIAAAVAPGADLRPVVDELARRAGGGSLQPGQRISVEGIAP